MTGIYYEKYILRIYYEKDLGNSVEKVMILGKMEGKRKKRQSAARWLNTVVVANGHHWKTW